MLYDPGSYRDPSGRVLADGERILRAVFEPGRKAFEAAMDAGIMERAVERSLLLPYRQLDLSSLPAMDRTASYLLEHPRLNFVSYPYEWSFSGLKAAALLHLDLHLELLGDGFTLSDATAYNVQFRGTKPVFIDHLSIIPYQDGEAWIGQRQFVMQFLAPLILWAKKGVAPNPWFRGSLEGIPPEDLLPLLSFRDRLSFTVLAHIIGPSKVQRQALAQERKEHAKPRGTLTRKRFEAILIGLRDYISGLSPLGMQTVWRGYDTNNSYDDDSRAAKHSFVAGHVAQVQPELLFDLGCNSGDYSQTALLNGAQNVIGFDFDFGALEQAFARFAKNDAPFLPLWLDATNPTPSQGWAEQERMSFSQRAAPDFLLALAFIHHLAIARNIPLEMAVNWLISLAPTGVIEFPDKGDAMVSTLLATRSHDYPDYSLDAFMHHLRARARIVDSQPIEGTKRTLVRYDRY